MEKLSVCVPVHNTANVLRRCIESLLEQTYPNLEIILVDDGSDDGSGDVCDEYAACHENVIALHQAAQGPIMARYQAVLAASGSVVTFVDSDDFVAHEMYKELMSLRLQYRADVVMSGAIRYHSDEHQVCTHDCVPKGLYNAQDIRDKFFPVMLWFNDNFGVDPALWSKVFSREILLPCYEQIKNLDFHYGEDMAIVYPLLCYCKSVYVTHRSYYYHRQRSYGEVPGYVRDVFYLDKLYILYKFLRKKLGVCGGDLLRQIDMWYAHAVNYKKRCYGLYYEFSSSYLFPFGKVKQGTVVAIYGAGRVGHEFVAQLEKTNYAGNVLWVDINYKQRQAQGLHVKAPRCLTEETFDVLVVAIKSKDMQKKIADVLYSQYNISYDKIILPEI